MIEVGPAGALRLAIAAIADHNLGMESVFEAGNSSWR